MIDKIKEIDIKTIIENETHFKFNKRGKLEECPFCGSGKGSNKSPAFSASAKKNFFKCFSCGVGGSNIDFMINLNKGWKESDAIKYLNKKYLNDYGNNESGMPALNKFEKMVYAIKNNPKEKAISYLSQRGIDTAKLPENCFYYDSYSTAIAFFDSENRLINRRFTKQDKGSPKANNQGKLAGGIFDKMFNPMLDTVFIHEGVINALSMEGYSSIAIFSTENKITDSRKLKRYIEGKHVVIAFDNDNAGDKAFEYYKNLILAKQLNIKSLQRLGLPEKEDANDLLCSVGLREFLNESSNYKIVWENILYKPINGDSIDKASDNDSYFFYKEGGCYWAKENAKGKPILKKLSNFVMEIVYHLTDGTKDSQRIIKFQRCTGELSLMELYSSEFSLEKFKKIIRSISGKGLSFFGSTIELEHVLAYCQDHEKNAIAINQLGYQKELGIYCFANAILTEENILLQPDNLGIVPCGESNYYLAPFSHANIRNEAYNDQRKFKYKGGQINFKEWGKLIFEAYGTNGAIGISFLILSLFRDYILQLTGFFPFLFLFGDQGAGKSNFINFFMHLFGEPSNGISLLNSTNKGFARSLTQRKNALYYLKEYSNAIDKKTVDVFKTGYDGELYTMAQKSNDNKTVTLEITSACMVDGNELPTSEAALFARMIVLSFGDNQFSEGATEAHKTLMENKEQGFCQITRELLSYRHHFVNSFKGVFNKIFIDMKLYLFPNNNVSDRHMKHMALLLAAIKVLEGKLNFPFEYTEFNRAVIENAKAQEELSNEIKDATVFWTAIAFKAKEQYCNITEGTHYKKDLSKEILYIKYKLLYPYYADYAKRNNIKVMDPHSLKELLTSQGNKSFIPNMNQARNTKAYIKKGFGSCYMFKYLQSEENNEIVINGVELGL